MRIFYRTKLFIKCAFCTTLTSVSPEYAKALKRKALMEYLIELRKLKRKSK